MKRLLVWLACAAALCGGVCAAGNWIPAPAGAAELLQRLAQARWIASAAKSGERIVYVFTDPNCPYCNDLWSAMQKRSPPGVQVRYLLVAVIDADSHARDAAILEAPNPAAALDQHERSFAHGGSAPKATSRPATNETISANEALMSALHIYATPGLVYLDEHQELKVFVGMPDPEQLRAILGNGGA